MNTLKPTNDIQLERAKKIRAEKNREEKSREDLYKEQLFYQMHQSAVMILWNLLMTYTHWYQYMYLVTIP